MAFNCRIYGHQGIVPLKVVEGESQAHLDSVYQLKQPYVWAQTISVSAVAASSTVVTLPVSGFANDPTSVLRIEVPDGSTVRYEINPPGRAVVAASASPSLSGKDQVQFGAAYTISLIDATGLA
jgi:hypothetical protein